MEKLIFGELINCSHQNALELILHWSKFHKTTKYLNNKIMRLTYVEHSYFARHMLVSDVNVSNTKGAIEISMKKEKYSIQFWTGGPEISIHGDILQGSTSTSIFYKNWNYVDVSTTKTWKFKNCNSKLSQSSINLMQ